ncbi:InlB B-repeat-containing protein [Termitidicoccus mucosus]|uniref:Sulfatase-modifying factor enzyme-like domain-containing protein n=1 Tax=Termitidicoccus mucosus TaxID=1184151 RepID=A0A178IDU8_9BACT|nr:hypothetical protein AW736_18205 [Opitutaceae bacterium TSB47]
MIPKNHHPSVRSLPRLAPSMFAALVSGLAFLLHPLAAPAARAAGVTVSSTTSLGAQMGTLTNGGTVSFTGEGVNSVLASSITLTSDPYVLNPGGAQHVTITGNNAVRVFENTGDIDLTLSNITITKGVNMAVNSSAGAVSIKLAGDSTTTTEFLNNGPATANGGAIYGATGIGITGSQGNLLFTGNYANSRGGALFVETGHITINTVITGTFSLANNSSTGAGMAVFTNSGSVTLSGTYGSIIIQGNKGNSNSVLGTNANGGVVINPFVSETFLVTSNSIRGGGGMVFAQIGALNLTANGPAGILIENNFADAAGGVFWLGGNPSTLTANSPAGIQIKNNTAKGNGGAIYINNSNVALTFDAKEGNIVFQGNRHAASAEPNAIFSNGGGGAILIIKGDHDVLFFDPVNSSKGAPTGVPAGSGIAIGSALLKTGAGSVLFSGSSSLLGSGSIGQGALLVNNGALLDMTAAGQSLVLQPGAIIGTYAATGSGAVKAEALDLSGILDAAGTSQLHLAGSATLNNITIRAGLSTGNQSGQVVIDDTAIFIGTGTIDIPSIGSSSGTFNVFSLANGTIPGGAFSPTLLSGGVPYTTGGATVQLSADSKNVQVVLTGTGGGGGPVNVTVTFDPQGGSVSPATKSATPGSPYGPLPTPAKGTDTFGGWWTSAGGAGSQVTASTTVAAAATDHTLYAKWTPYTPPSGPGVTVTATDTLRDQMNTLTGGGSVNFTGDGLNSVLASAVTLTSNTYALNPGGAQHVTISGNNTVRAFDNTGDINLTLSNITITRGVDMAIASTAGAVNITLAAPGAAVEFLNNGPATSHGGAIYGATGISITGTQDNLLFTGNFANSRGSAMYVNGGNLTINTSITGTLSFENNSATAVGGAAYASTGTFVLSGTYGSIVIQGNKSKSNSVIGGDNAIVINPHVTDTFLITSNSVSGGGGVTYSNGPLLLTANGPAGIIVTSNTAGNGGAFYLANATHHITANSPAGIQITNNTATGNGGAIYMNNGGAPLNLNAVAGDIVFQGNKQGGASGTPNAIRANSSGGNPLNISGSHNVLFFDPVYSPSADAGSISKTGDGSVLFSGSNTWRGNTAVSAGALLVNDGALLDTAAAGRSLTLAPGAILGTYATAGSGTIKADALALSGILYATGSASQLHLAGSSTLNSITLFADTHAGDQSGLTVIDNTATFAGTGTVDLQNMAATSGTFNVLRYEAGVIPAGAFSATLLYQGAPYTLNGAAVQLSADSKTVQVVLPGGSASPVTVTLDTDGGTVSPPTLTVTPGTAYGALPVPTKANNTFGGWWTQTGGTGTQVIETTIVGNSSDHTLYAKWTQNPQVVTVTFDAQGGSVSPASQPATVGSAYGTLPVPSKTDHTFNGWFTADTGGTKIEATTTVATATNHTLYAQWTAIPPATTVTVTFDPQGGSVTPPSMTATVGAAYGALPIPVKADNLFGGWFTAPGGGGSQVIASTTVPAGAHTLYAQWTPVPPPAGTTVTFDAQGGMINVMTKPVTPGQIYGPLPAPSKSGSLFAGWWTAPDGGGTQVAPITAVPAGAASHTLHAKWIAAPTAAAADYLVIDLSGGPAAAGYPVRTGATPPGDIAINADCRTTELWLRRVQSGAFQMGSPDTELGRSPDEPRHNVTFTAAYYIGVFEITQRQWQLVMGANPSYHAGDTRPVEGVSYESIRGGAAGAGWPDNDAVDADSFIGKLRAKTGLPLDLPTEAQWEHAARAGATTALNSGQNLSTTPRADAGLDALGRYSLNQDDGQGGSAARHTAAGSYLPNAWGLYDMHGNAREYCLDWYGSLATAAATDPLGAATGTKRVTRGGGWDDAAVDARSAARFSIEPYNDSPGTGLRIASAIPESRPPVLSLSPSATQSVGVAPGTLVFTVTNTGGGSMPWSAEISAGIARWARIASIVNDGDSGTITVDYDANMPGGALRAATLTVTATGADGAAATVTIEQAGNPDPNSGGSGGGAPSLPVLALLAALALLRAVKTRRGAAA